MSQVFLRDTGQVVAVVNNFIRFGVPMMYPYSLVAERFRGHTDLYLANPIADAVLLVQRCFWVPTTADQEATDPGDTCPTTCSRAGSSPWPRGSCSWSSRRGSSARFENKIPERL